MFEFLSQPATFQLPDPQQMQARAMTLQQLTRQGQMDDYKIAEYQRALAGQQALSRVLPDLQRQDFSREAVNAALQQNPDAAPFLLDYLDKKVTQEQTRRKAEAEIDKTRAEADEKRGLTRAKAIGEVANTAFAQTQQGKFDVGGIVSIAQASGVKLPVPSQGMTDEDYVRQLSTITTDPRAQLEMLRINKLLPLEMQEKTGQIAKNAAETAAIPVNAQSQRISANAAATNAQTIRMQYTNPNAQHVSDGQGGLYAFNPATRSFAAATGPDGALLPRLDKPLTETQGNATAFGMRMRDASKTIRDLEAAGVVDPSGVLVAASGNTGYAAPVLNAAAGAMNPYAQVYKQAQKNWVTANLRKESGAAIPTDEMEADIAKWFPVQGDRPEVIRAKAAAREVAERAMVVQAGPGSKNIPAASGGRSASGSIGGNGQVVKSAKLPMPESLPDGTEVTDDRTGEVLVVRNGRYQKQGLR